MAFYPSSKPKGNTHTHTHTHTRTLSVSPSPTNILTAWLFSIPPMPYSLPDHSVQVLVLQMTHQTHLGISWQPHCLLPHIQTAVPVWFWVNVEGVKSQQHSFTIQQNIHFSSVHGIHFSLHYCGVLSAVKTPTHQSANITVHFTQNEKTVTIQVCQYQYSSSNNDWLVHNELEWMRKEVVTACLKY